MNVLEMHDAVTLGLDKNSASLELPAFEPEEIDYWLNEAQLQLVKQKAFGNNFRGEGFEDSGKRTDDLLPLVTESSEVSLASHSFYPNVKVLDVSSLDTVDAKYMFFISATAKYDSANPDYNSSLPIVETIPVLQNELRNLIQTEFNTPYIKTPYVYFYESKIGFIHDPYKSLESAYVTFIRRPKELVRTGAVDYQVTESELPEQVHPEIVALTVNLMLENIDSDRQQNNLFQLSKKE